MNNLQDKPQVVDPRNARSGPYRQQLEEIQTSGLCPFCPGGQTYVEEMEMFVAENEHWLIKHSKVPYTNAAVHLVCISRQHKTRLEQLTPEEWSSLNPLIRSVIEKEGLPTEGGNLFVREGDTTLTGATVCHLHFNYVIPEPGKIIEVRFGGWIGKAEWEE